MGARGLCGLAPNGWIYTSGFAIDLLTLSLRCLRYVGTQF